jgi:hypothetical protein
MMWTQEDGVVNDVAKGELEPGRSDDTRRGGRVLTWSGAGRGGRGYDAAFDAALRRTLELHGRLESAKAGALDHRTRLLSQPPRRRRLLLTNHARYGGWWLAWLLLDEAEARLVDAPREAQRLSGLALEALPDGARDAPGADSSGAAETADGGVDPDGVWEPLDEDVRARAWRLRAEARHRLGDLATAASCLARSQRHRRRGTGEPLERALLFECRGRLQAARGRRRRAASLLRRAARELRRLRDAHLEGRARAFLGLLLADQSGGAAAAELERALRLLDADREPDLVRQVERRAADLALAAPLYPAAVLVCAGAASVAGPVLSPPA